MSSVGCEAERVIIFVSHSVDAALSLFQCRPLVCCFVPPTTTGGRNNKPVEVSVGRRLDVGRRYATWRMYVATPRPCSEAMEGVYRLRQSRGNRPEHRKSGESSNFQARKRNWTVRLLPRRAITCSSGVSTPAGRDIRDYWRWRREHTPIAQPTGGRLT